MISWIICTKWCTLSPFSSFLTQLPDLETLPYLPFSLVINALRWFLTSYNLFLTSFSCKIFQLLGLESPWTCRVMPACILHSWLTHPSRFYSDGAFWPFYVKLRSEHTQIFHPPSLPYLVFFSIALYVYIPVCFPNQRASLSFMRGRTYLYCSLSIAKPPVPVT